MKKGDVIWLLGRLFLGSVFVYAGVMKVTASVQDFHALILDYEVLPYVLAKAVAWVLPWAEVIFGIFLILGFLPRFSAGVLSFFSLSFLGMLSVSYLKLGAFPENCGCFGDNLHLTPSQLLTLDTVDLLLGVRLAFLKKHILSLDGWLRGPVTS